MVAWTKLHQPNNSQNWNSCPRSGHVLAHKTSHCRAVEFCLLIIAHSQHSVHCKFGVWQATFLCVVWEWWRALIRASLLGLNSEGASAGLPFSDSCPKFVCCYLYRTVAEFETSRALELQATTALRMRVTNEFAFHFHFRFLFCFHFCFHCFWFYHFPAKCEQAKGTKSNLLPCHCKNITIWNVLLCT